MTRFFLPLIILALVSSSWTNADVLKPSLSLPGCTLQKVSGDKEPQLVKLADAQRGKKTVLHIFASW